MSTFPYLKKFAILFLSWIFGFKWIVTFYQTFVTYYDLTPNNLMTMFFVFNWNIYGFISATAQLIVTLMYVSFYFKNEVMGFKHIVEESISELKKKSDNDMTDEDKQLVSFYDTLVNVKHKLIKYYEKFKSFVTTTKFIFLVNKVNDIAQKKETIQYLNKIESLFAYLIETSWSYIIKLSYFNSLYEKVSVLYNYELPQNENNDKINADIQHLEKMLGSDNKQQTEMFKMMDALGSYQNVQNLKSGTNNQEQNIKNDMEQLGSMLKMLSDMESTIKQKDTQKDD
jgi:hypothetical protein